MYIDKLGDIQNGRGQKREQYQAPPGKGFTMAHGKLML